MDCRDGGCLTAAVIVEAFDVLEDRVRELDSGVPSLAVEQFDLQSCPECLGDGVVIGITDGAKGRQQAGSARSVGEDPRRELGGFNWSSQHLDLEVARWLMGRGSRRFVSIGGRFRRRDGPRWRGVRTESGSGRRSRVG